MFFWLFLLFYIIGSVLVYGLAIGAHLSLYAETHGLSQADINYALLPASLSWLIIIPMLLDARFREKQVSLAFVFSPQYPKNPLFRNYYIGRYGAIKSYW